MADTTCTAKTTSGKRCAAKVLTGSRFCFAHDPSQGAKRAQARKRGGERNRTPHNGDESIIPSDMNTLADAKKILAYTLAEILPMENSIARARVLLSLFDSFVKSFEIGELEERIAALEATIKK